MRFEVPQFIEIEDKIFGPLTWRQFVYVGGGAGIAAVLFFMAPFIVFIIFAVPVAFLAFLLSFYPVNNRPFSIFLEAAVGYFRNTRLYLWRKQGSGIYNDMEEKIPAGIPAYTPPTSSSNITSLSRRLEMKAIQKDA